MHQNDATAIAKDLVSVMERDDVSLFAGAGVSLSGPAHLPSALQLKWMLIEALMDRRVPNKDRQQVEEYLASEMLELMLDGFREVFGDSIYEILDVFRSGMPNDYHLLAAKLTRAGLIKRIYTTNFDCLFERALAREGVPYYVASTEDDFSELWRAPN